MCTTLKLTGTYDIFHFFFTGFTEMALRSVQRNADVNSTEGQKTLIEVKTELESFARAQFQTRSYEARA